MSRPDLQPERIDPAIRERVAQLHADVRPTAVAAILPYCGCTQPCGMKRSAQQRLAQVPFG